MSVIASPAEGVAKQSQKLILLTFGLIEIIIGMTLLALHVASLKIPPQPPAYSIFIISTSLTSITLGLGILRARPWARMLLLFFAGYVLLTKLLMLGHIITGPGGANLFLLRPLKNWISVIYHLSILAVFNLESIKNKFTR